MRDTTVGNVQFGPGREPPRVPMEPLKDCTVIGSAPVLPPDVPGYVEWLEIRLEHLDPWARAALERGVKAMQEDVL